MTKSQNRLRPKSRKKPPRWAKKSWHRAWFCAQSRSSCMRMMLRIPPMPVWVEPRRISLSSQEGTTKLRWMTRRWNPSTPSAIAGQPQTTSANSTSPGLSPTSPAKPRSAPPPMRSNLPRFSLSSPRSASPPSSHRLMGSPLISEFSLHTEKTCDLKKVKAARHAVR